MTKTVDRVCSRCELKNTCKEYQDSLKDTDRFLFGCSRGINEDDEEQGQTV